MRRHSADLGALTGGLVLMAAGLFGVLASPERVGEGLRWLWPLVMLGLGVSLLIRSSTRGRDRDRVRRKAEPAQTVDSESTASLFSGEPPSWSEDREDRDKNPLRDLSNP